ncbi:DNA invertase Pin-like site-specific DNA recombinase [Sphingobium sp. B11D3D]|nr:DNA invertase Pin-like site-specific DNA recombinase [Sphingobium sp. B11D3D]
MDRLGRDAIDVQATVRRLLDAGVTVDVHGIGPIGRGVGELILAVLAQVAEMERRRIAERTEAGRKAARRALQETGRTHRGKESLGRPFAKDAAEVRRWRQERGASIKGTAEHFGLSLATVKRYCALPGE